MDTTFYMEKKVLNIFSFNNFLKKKKKKKKKTIFLEKMGKKILGDTTMFCKAP